jgi:hypothetical protein
MERLETWVERSKTVFLGGSGTREMKILFKQQPVSTAD